MTDTSENKPQKRLRLEAIITTPPTKKCKATVAVMEEMTRRFPDVVRLDVYALGQSWPVTPTVPCLSEMKMWRVPSAYVNGRLLARQAAPEPDELEARIREELAKGPEAWQA